MNPSKIVFFPNIFFLSPPKKSKFQARSEPNKNRVFLEVVCARKILIWWIINSKIAIYLSHFRMNIRFDQLTPTIDWTFGSHFPESSTTPIITGLDVSYLVKFTCCHLWIIRSMATTCFDKTWRDGTHWDEETRRRRSFTIGPPETILVSLRNFTIWITHSPTDQCACTE